MSVLAEKYELPANGASRITNSSIAAALATIGIGGARQMTEHRKRGAQDYKYFSFHLLPVSNQFPEIKTSELVGNLQQKKISRDGPWTEPVTLFMAAWVALENRRIFLEAMHLGTVESLRMRKIGGNLCLLEHPAHREVHDLRAVAAAANEPTAVVKSQPLIRALITVGFAPVRFLEDGALMTRRSLTFPGLTLDLCVTAQGAIFEYNKAVAEALSRGALVLPTPPKCDLPGGGPNGHVFENACQAGLNLTQILKYVLPKAGKTYAFQSARHATRSAIIDASASPQAIDAALTFATRR